MSSVTLFLEAALQGLSPSALECVLQQFRSADKAVYPQTLSGFARMGVKAQLIAALQTIHDRDGVRECVLVSAAVAEIFSCAGEDYAAYIQVERYLRHWLKGDATTRPAVAKAVRAAYGRDAARLNPPIILPPNVLIRRIRFTDAVPPKVQQPS